MLCDTYDTSVLYRDTKSQDTSIWYRPALHQRQLYFFNTVDGQKCNMGPIKHVESDICIKILASGATCMNTLQCYKHNKREKDKAAYNIGRLNYDHIITTVIACNANRASTEQGNNERLNLEYSQKSSISPFQVMNIQFQ